MVRTMEKRWSTEEGRAGGSSQMGGGGAESVQTGGRVGGSDRALRWRLAKQAGAAQTAGRREGGRGVRWSSAACAASVIRRGIPANREVPTARATRGRGWRGSAGK